MDWVDKPQSYKGLYGILQLLRGSHLNNFPLKTLKLGWVPFHSVTFQSKCLDFQSNQYTETRPSPLTFLQLGIVPKARRTYVLSTNLAMLFISHLFCLSLSKLWQN